MLGYRCQRAARSSEFRALNLKSFPGIQYAFAAILDRVIRSSDFAAARVADSIRRDQLVAKVWRADFSEIRSPLPAGQL